MQKILTEQMFEKLISSLEISGAYFLYGDEKVFLDRSIEMIQRVAAGIAFSDFNYIKLDFENTELDQIESESNNLPMFSEKRIVMVSGFDADKLSTAEVNRFIDIIKKLEKHTVMIFYNRSFKAVKISAKWKKLLSATFPEMKLVEYKKRSNGEINKLLVKTAKDFGKNLNNADAQKMMDICGTDLMVLLNELEKVCFYSKSMQIDREDILAVVTSNNESKIFDLANLLLSGRYSDAYCQLDVLFQNNEEPVVILSILASNIINVYRMKCATENGMSLSEVSETFKYGNREFQLKSAGRFTGKYSRVQLEHIMVEVLKTDLLLKSSAASKKQAQRVIENCFAKIILISNN